MSYTYPDAQDVGITIPRRLKKERFENGFRHALAGGQITQAQHLRLSFREGYRAGKLYLRCVRLQQGIVEFPMRGRVRMVSVY